MIRKIISIRKLRRSNPLITIIIIEVMLIVIMPIRLLELLLPRKVGNLGEVYVI
jgi:hypothetical protein